MADRPLIFISFEGEVEEGGMEGKGLIPVIGRPGDMEDGEGAVLGVMVVVVVVRLRLAAPPVSSTNTYEQMEAQTGQESSGYNLHTNHGRIGRYYCNRWALLTLG